MSLHIWKWIKGWNLFPKGAIKSKVLPAVVTILEGAKGVLESGVVKTVASLIKGPDGHLGQDILDAGDKIVLKGIAVALAIEGLPDNATEEQIKEFDDKVIAAVAGQRAAESIPGEVISRLGAHIYASLVSITSPDSEGGTKATFGEIARAIEDAWDSYQEYKKEAEDEAASN